MDLQFSVADERFRDEVRDFLSRRLTPELRDYAARMTSVYADKPIGLAWQKILVDQGWAAPSWPVAYGGCDWSVAQHFIWQTELARAGAPPMSPMGINMCGPALIGHGSPEQKAHYLPRILSGEDFWCQGYSEPQAGSDLAALMMSAVPDGDDFICNGTKIWTTHAHEANMMFCLVRTSAAPRRQDGITFLLIDMTSPGVRVDPILMLTGEHIQNTIFFDDVRVPMANVIGEVDKGWTVAKYLLGHERMGTGGIGGSKRELAKVKVLATKELRNGKPLLDDPRFRDKVSRVEVELMALEITNLRFLDQLRGGRAPGAEVSLLKIKGTEIQQALTELLVEVMGPLAQPFRAIEATEFDTSTAALLPRYFNYRKTTIYAGSNEIQRNIIAKATLGL